MTSTKHESDIAIDKFPIKLVIKNRKNSHRNWIAVSMQFSLLQSKQIYKVIKGLAKLSFTYL